MMERSTNEPDPAATDARKRRHASIGTRVRIGLGVLLALHLLLAVVAHFGFTGACTAIEEYERTEYEAAEALAIDGLGTELQRAVSMYLRTGYTSAEERTRELSVQLSLALSEASGRASEFEGRETIGLLQGLLASYADHFEKLAEDRKAQDRVVRDGLVGAVAEIIEVYEALGAAREPGHESSFLDAMGRAERAAMQYVLRPDSDEILAFDAAVGDARAVLRAMDPAPASRASLDRVAARLAAYESAFGRVCQITRGRLHLMNVVMAGEAAEFHWLSRELREQGIERSSALLVQTKQRLIASQVLSGAFSGATIIAAIVACWVIVKSVTRPIMRIATAFGDIASGRHSVRVPYLERDDEIGRMASAAEVFRNQSIESQQLVSETRRLAADVERKSREIESFVYSASHDLKSPLVSLMGYLGYLKDDIGNRRYDRVDRFLVQIDDASQRIRRNIDDLLELSRAGTAPMQTERFRFSEIVETALADWRVDIAQRGIACSVLGGDTVLVGDRDRLTDLVGNLIANAIKYGCADNSPAVRVAAERDGSWVVLKVSDDGPGIHPENHDRIFGMFERLSSSEEGTGLGLSIVRKIAEAHGGRVRVESTPGAGATFTVHLPIAVAGGEGS